MQYLKLGFRAKYLKVIIHFFVENIPHPSLLNIYPSHYQFDNAVRDNVRDVMDGGNDNHRVTANGWGKKIAPPVQVYRTAGKTAYCLHKAMYYGLLTMPCYLFSIRQDIFEHTHISILSCHGNVTF